MPETRRLAGTICVRVEPRVAGEHVLPRAHRHHDLLEGRVAGPLAQAVHRALDLARSVHDRGERIGDRQPEIVVAVHRPDRLVGVRNALAQRAGSASRTARASCIPPVSGMLTVVAPSRITASRMRHRKSNSERPASSGENSTSSVNLRAKLHRVHRLGEHLVGRHPQLLLHVDRARWR